MPESSDHSTQFSNYQGAGKKMSLLYPKFKYSFKTGLEMKSIFHKELTTQKREIIHSDFSLK